MDQDPFVLGAVQTHGFKLILKFFDQLDLSCVLSYNCLKILPHC